MREEGRDGGEGEGGGEGQVREEDRDRGGDRDRGEHTLHIYLYRCTIVSNT